MRTALRLVSLAILVVGVAFWFFGGPHLGWTKTTVPVTKYDPITEIEYIEWERNFLPGVDFLGGFLAAAGVVFGLSWLARHQPTQPQG